MIHPPNQKGEFVYLLCPALNEERTIEEIVKAGIETRRVKRVVVVDNGSSDRTAELASRAGSLVVHCPVVGKAQAVKAGLEVIRTFPNVGDAQGIVLLDGDLRGLTTNHIDSLIDPLGEGSTEMVCGHISKSEGRFHFLTVAMHTLTGQRSITFDALDRVDWTDLHGYLLEVGLNRVVPRHRIHRILLNGVSHTRREQRIDTKWASVFRLPAFAAGPWSRIRVACAYICLALK